jgi:uncharacterized protein with HEPN domain
VKDDRLYLHHMLERCRRITRFIEPGREALLASDQLQDAVIRNLEVIGEAATSGFLPSRGRACHRLTGRPSAACATY